MSVSIEGEWSQLKICIVTQCFNKKLGLNFCMFDFHKLTVYKKTKEFNKEILILSNEIKYQHRSLQDQLIRSSTSILLNIAEGSGRPSKKDRRHFYVISKGSTNETVAILDILLDLGYISTGRYKNFLSKMEEISKMLYGLIKSMN